MYKILIRPLEKKDALISWKWRNDSDIWEFTGSRPDITITPEIEINWIEKILADSRSKRFAIIVDEIYVGNIQLTNITKNEAEYHIFIGEKSYWGKGIAFSATQQIIRFAKNNLKLDNIYLKVNPEHLKAIKLYEKSGFKVVSDEVKMVVSLDKMIKPMVSVFCLVYNHEKYLRDCLESILMQKCSFDYEIVVGEDCSNDASRAILKEYDKKYPGRFKLLLHENNIGAMQNQILVLKNCTGKFIAMCEGDDYWTDPYKLQQQVNFLEANPEYVLTHHDASVIDENGKHLRNSKLPSYSKKDFEGSELQRDVSLATLTLCFRNIFLNNEFDFPNVVNGDLALISILGLYGKGKYMEGIQNACYRVHSGGIWSQTSRIRQNTAKYETFQEMSSYYFRLGNKELGVYYRKRLKQQFKVIFLYYIKNRNFKEAIRYFRKFNMYYIHSNSLFKTFIQR